MNLFDIFKRMKVLRQLIIFAGITGVLIFAGGCSLMTKPPQVMSPPVVDLIQQLEQKNDTLTSYKGIGTIRLTGSDGIRQTSRLAWMANPPSKFLFILRNAFGQPILQVSGDGEYLYYTSQHPEPVFHKHQSSNPGLKSFISIPIRVSEIIDLLRGKTPLPAFDRATLHAAPDQEGTGLEKVLKLRKNWPGWTRKIYLNRNNEIYKIERFDTKERLIYQAELKNYQMVDGYALPFEISLSTADGNRFELWIDRYRVNFSVSPEMFVLTPGK